MMAFTEEQLKAAAREALAAGDQAAAKRLVNAARQVGGNAAQPVAPAKPARQLPEGYERLLTTDNGGDIFRKPDGSLGYVDANVSLSGPDNQARIQDMLDGGDGRAEMQSQTDRQTIGQNPIAARAAKFLQGLPFVGEYVDEAIGQFSPRAMEGVRAAQAAMDREKPVQSTLLQIGGGIVGSAPIAAVAGPALLASAPNALMARVAAGVATGLVAGATEGAVSGYGAGNDGDRADSAVRRGIVGGGLGLVLGGAAPAAAQGVSNLLQRLKRTDVSIIQRTLNISPDAAKRIKLELDADNFAAAEQALKRAGSDSMLADAAPQLLDEAMQSSGAANRIGREAIDARASAAGKKVDTALNWLLGRPDGRKGIKATIRQSTAKARQGFYDRAFAQEIDWRSPAGMELRAILDSTPDEVLRRAARNSSMRLDPNAKAIPDSVYAADFEPSVSVKAGEFSGNYAEKQQIKAFFDTLKSARREAFMKRPFTHVFKSQGVDPSGRLAQELRARGITPQTTPGLFRYGGLKDADNLPWSELPEGYRDVLARDGQYISQQSIIDALESELRGAPVDELNKAAARADLAQLEEAAPEYLTRRLQLGREEAAFARRAPTAPKDIATRGDIVPQKTIQDIDQIKRALDEIRFSREEGLMGGITDYAREAGQRAARIRDLLGEISPIYKKALAESSDTIRRTKAVDIGSKLLSRATTREDVADFVAGASKGELKAAAQGLRSAIDETLANVSTSLGRIDFGNAAQVQAAEEAVKMAKLMSSRANMDKLTAVIGKGRAEKLLGVLDEAAAQLQLRLNTARNSATFARQAGAAKTNQILDARDFLAPDQDVTFGNVVRKVWQNLVGKTTEAKAARKEAFMAEVARALTEKRGPEAERALQIIRQAIEGQPIKSADAAFVGRALASSLGLGGYQTGMQSLAKP